MKYFLVLACAFLLAQTTHAQNRYVVRFRDKGSNPFTLNNPSAYLSQRAIDRRTRYSIALDSTDLPVTPRYIDSLRLAGAVVILNASKWLNSVTIRTNDAAALSKIGSLPFVVSVAGIAERTAHGAQPGKFDEEQTGNDAPGQRVTGIASDYFNYGLSAAQIDIHNGNFLHNIGLRGQNMIIGILDGGFYHYQTLSAFDSARANGQVLGTWDFVAQENSVNEDDAHGMECFSIIASNIPGQFVGAAPKASFYLFRSEDVNSEYPIEEHNWVCGAERVDSSGGDVISSSLGYGDQMSDPVFDQTYSQLDGNTTMAAIGADLAAKKGILVVNAAGNEGTGSWHYILTPADGDSVLAVGAVNTSGVVADFSSYGPSADGQIKPDVASVGVGTVIETTGNTVSTGSGTSFATPNMAGLATCLWQGFPEVNNMTIVQALRNAGNHATSPDVRVGYGIPDMKKAVLSLLQITASDNASESGCKTTINWTSKDLSSMKYEIERMLPGQQGYSKIGEQAGTGNIFASHSYQYQDQLGSVPAGPISYRIREIIDTAASTFSAAYLDTVSVTLTNACITTSVGAVNPNERKVVLSPNPAVNQVTLTIDSPDPLHNLVIKIINMKGQLVFLQKADKGSGHATFELSISGLAVGRYVVSVYNGNQLIANKEMVKL